MDPSSSSRGKEGIHKGFAGSLPADGKQENKVGGATRWKSCSGVVPEPAGQAQDAASDWGENKQTRKASNHRPC